MEAWTPRGDDGQTRPSFCGFPRRRRRKVKKIVQSSIKYEMIAVVFDSPNCCMDQCCSSGRPLILRCTLHVAVETGSLCMLRQNCSLEKYNFWQLIINLVSTLLYKTNAFQKGQIYNGWFLKKTCIFGKMVRFVSDHKVQI